MCFQMSFKMYMEVVKKAYFVQETFLCITSDDIEIKSAENKLYNHGVVTETMMSEFVMFVRHQSNCQIWLRGVL